MTTKFIRASIDAASRRRADPDYLLHCELLSSSAFSYFGGSWTTASPSTTTWQASLLVAPLALSLESSTAVRGVHIAPSITSTIHVPHWPTPPQLVSLARPRYTSNPLARSSVRRMEPGAHWKTESGLPFWRTTTDTGSVDFGGGGSSDSSSFSFSSTLASVRWTSPSVAEIASMAASSWENSTPFTASKRMPGRTLPAALAEPPSTTSAIRSPAVAPSSSNSSNTSPSGLGSES
mmetsp:Transcript_5846/g.14973  ORF Transcript_5846/g.14973 Transcript_5846/m.14973 type:complete len:235 (+) Transcript_5846:985-1689(+)